MRPETTANPHFWYIVGALWGDPCFCISKGVAYVGVYGEIEFCERFMESLFEVYGMKGRVYFNKSIGCHVGAIRGKSAKIKKIYHGLNQFGPYGVNSWRVPDILHDEVELSKIRALRGYFDAEGCPYYDIKRGDRRIEAESKNREGLQQIQNLLSSLDISSKLLQDRDWWKLRISHQMNIRRFRDSINFAVN